MSSTAPYGAEQNPGLMRRYRCSTVGTRVPAGMEGEEVGRLMGNGGLGCIKAKSIQANTGDMA